MKSFNTTLQGTLDGLAKSAADLPVSNFSSSVFSTEIKLLHVIQ